MKKKSVRLAIFDIDGTIFRSSLLIELFNALVDQKVFPAKARTEVEKKYLAWLNRKGHYNDYLSRLIRVHYRYQRGKSSKTVEKIIDDVIKWQKDRVYRYTRNAIRDFKKEGYLVMAISNSQDYMVRQFGKLLGFDVVFGRIPEVKNGYYTGHVLSNGHRIPFLTSLDKVSILKEFLKKRKIKVDLKNSVAVGDSEGDIPLLSFVGKPIAFNPSRILAEYAKRRRWKIIIERKDIAYDIRDCDFILVDGK